MLNLLTGRRFQACDGSTRRDFLKIGSLGAGALGLPSLLAARSQAAAAGQSVKDTSVVWLWLGGGPTHIETFDPKLSAPSEYRSITGEVATSLPGVTFGGTFPKMARQADKLAVVRSFAHGNSGHGGGTHWVMTGYDDRNADNGGVPSRPGLGAIVSRVRGPVQGYFVACDRCAHGLVELTLRRGWTIFLVFSTDTSPLVNTRGLRQQGLFRGFADQDSGYPHQF